MTGYKKWKEATLYLLTFHVNFKEDVFGIKEFNIAKKYNLALIRQDDSVLKYKGKIENEFSDSKYLFLKHLNKTNRFHFCHHHCKLKLINNVTTCIRFYQKNIHEKKKFASKYSIYVIPEPRPYKYYNYFDFFYFFYFFEFCQRHKSEYALDVGRAFCTYLSETDTEVFTTLKIFFNPNNIYKGVMDYRVYFLVHENSYVTTLKIENHLNIYISKTFGTILKKGNDPVLFDTLLTFLGTNDRARIYSGMKNDVLHYGLKSFYSDYEYLGDFYWLVKVNNTGSIEPPIRAMVPHKLIRDSICRRNKDFNLTNIARDQRLLNLLPEKTDDFYPTSDFYKDFTNFQLEENEKKILNREISSIFTLHIVHSDKPIYDESITCCKYLFLQKQEVYVKILTKYFTTFCMKTIQKFLQQKINLKLEKKIKSYTLSKKNGTFTSYINQIEDAGNHGIYHYISESFYTVLLNTNLCLKEIYHN